MTDRTDILQRIINLRELADNNTSEAEAMNAMKLADKMMQSYRIEEAELALAEASGEITVDVVSRRGGKGQLNVGRNRHKVQSCLWDIERYCEVKVVLNTRYRWRGANTKTHAEQQYHVIGDRPDVELFEYLVSMVRDALDRSYDTWRRTQQSVGRGAKASFQLAMAERIGDRLRKMRHDRDREREETLAEEARLLNRPVDDLRAAMANGNLADLSPSVSLVVVSAAEQKREAVQSAFQTEYADTRLGTASGFGYASNGSAASAGRSAGNNVNFSRPVGGTAAGRLSA